MDILSQLNPVQQQAVTCVDQPLLVVAGAGSGKTRVITYKVAYLLHRRLYRPENILAVTFTNKAAGEMLDRVRELLGPGSQVPLICTFHSFCARFLRREIGVLGYPTTFSIYDSDDQLRMIKESMKELQISDQTIQPSRVQYCIGQAKIHRVTPDGYTARHRQAEDQLISKLYTVYERRMAAAGALDFDDLLLKTNQILAKNSAIRERLSRQYQYLLVDEFQDTNPPQYELVRYLTSTHHHICVVGDEDQSIYGFRGAILANILHFEKDFPGTKVFKLEENYRSTKYILKAASSLVAHNVQRREKTLWTSNAEGQPVGLYRAVDPSEEAGWIARAVRESLMEDTRAVIGILYRINSQSRRLEDALRSQSIQYRVVGGLSFYKRKEIKDLVAYLKLIMNPRDDVAFLRIINTPPRGIGEHTVNSLSSQAAATGRGLWDTLQAELAGDTLNARSRSALSAFRDLREDLTRRSSQEKLGEFLHGIYKRTGYQEMLEQTNDPDNQNRQENIRELLTSAQEHEKAGGNLDSFMDRVALYSDADEADYNGRVTLMTLHGAKGLEFDRVFLAGLEEGLLPHQLSLGSEDDIEEERRLCYVGITRARQQLVITQARTRPKSWGDAPAPTQPSRFLKEIPLDCLMEIPPFTALSLALKTNTPERGKKETRLRDQGFQTLDTSDDVRSFFSGRGGRTERDGKTGHPAPPSDQPEPKSSPRPAPPARPSPMAGRIRQAMTTPVRPSASGTALNRGGLSAVSPAGGFKTGDQVQHELFGPGRVVKVEPGPKGRKLTISFNNRGLKILLEHLANLKKV